MYILLEPVWSDKNDMNHGLRFLEVPKHFRFSSQRLNIRNTERIQAVGKLHLAKIDDPVRTIKQQVNLSAQPNVSFFIRLPSTGPAILMR